MSDHGVVPGPSAGDSVDVVIVGYGPVGKLLAITLGRAGHRVLVVERQQRGYPLPRAVTHDAEFARILQSIGLPPDEIPEITQPYDAMYVWRNQLNETLLEVDWSGIGSSGWSNTYFFNQPDLEDRLDDIARNLPTVQVLRGWQVTDHSDDSYAVRVIVKDAEHSVERTLTAQYLIGADGASSQVRERMKAGWHDLGYFFDWLVVDVLPSPELNFPHVAIQTCDVSRPATMVPGGPRRRRWEFMLLPGEKAEDLNRTDVAWRLLSPFGVTSDNAELERHSVYTFHAGWAQQWRRGRVLIAGDAAHLMPPFAGQGLGAGMRDAMNLSWKLSAVLSGTASDTLLDTYGSERTAHVAAFIDFSMSLGKVICITDPAEAAARDERMKSEAVGGRPPAPPQPRLGAGAHFSPHGGMLSAQYRVAWADDAEHGPARLDDLLGGAGVLLLADPAGADVISATHRATLAAVGIAVAGLTATEPGTGLLGALRDVDAGYGRWLADLGVAAVLIRPDFYVFDTAVDLADLGAMLDRFAASMAGAQLHGHPYSVHGVAGVV